MSNKHKPGHRRKVTTSSNRCLLCGLPIPDYVASPTHPLYMTVDHLIPLSAGGSDSPGNRVAAHQCCNRAKSNQVVFTQEFIDSLVYQVEVHLKRIGYPQDMTKHPERYRLLKANIFDDAVTQKPNADI